MRVFRGASRPQYESAEPPARGFYRSTASCYCAWNDVAREQRSDRWSICDKPVPPDAVGGRQASTDPHLNQSDQAEKVLRAAPQGRPRLRAVAQIAKISIRYRSHAV